MTWRHISALPTTTQGVLENMGPGVRHPSPTVPGNPGGPIHESCLRAYHIVQEVEQMLKRNDSQETILKAIEAMQESGDEV